MQFDKGVNPNVIDEGDLDVKQAKAGADLFKSKTEKTYAVDTTKLFREVQGEIILEEEGRDLFESKIEVSNVSPISSAGPSQQINVILVIVLCLICVVTYIYYLIQKRSIQKNLKASKKHMMTIQ